MITIAGRWLLAAFVLLGGCLSAPAYAGPGYGLMSLPRPAPPAALHAQPLSTSVKPFFDVEFTNANRYMPATPSGLSPMGKPVWQSTGGGSVAVGGEWPTLGDWNNYLGDAASTPATDPFAISGGTMAITLQPGTHPSVSYDPTLANYVGGMLDTFTLPGGTFTGARIEVRAKMPTGGAPNSGIWPAIWLGTTSNATPAEIDIVELLGSDPLDLIHVTTHYGVAGQNLYNSQAPAVNGDTSQWHVYGVDFNSTQPGSRVNFYFDDVLVASAPMQGSMVNAGNWFLMMNNSVGTANSWPCGYGGIAGCPHITGANTMLIDYVRMYPPGTVIPAAAH